MTKTLIFDCDGVLADTERDGHRPAFNQTFREFGFPIEWSEAEYAVKLQIAGGKERMASDLTPEYLRGRGLPDDEDVLYGPLNNPNQLKQVTGFIERLPAHARVEEDAVSALKR